MLKRFIENAVLCDVPPVAFTRDVKNLDDIHDFNILDDIYRNAAVAKRII